MAQTALSNQIHAGLDLVFPGLTGCFSHGLEGVSLRVIMREIPDPDRVRRLGVDGLVRFVRRRDARITQAKAAQVVETARQVLRLPAADWNAASAVLAADVTFFFALEEEIAKATAELSTVLPDTPAGVLTSLPGVGNVTASAYGAAIGDPARFKNAAGAYRASGLVPMAYESAGKSRRGNRISREGSVELRRAIVDLGRGMGFHHADFAAYRRRLISEGKPPLVATIAVGHRAHRLAFSLMKSGTPYDPIRWVRSVAEGDERRRQRRRGDGQARHGEAPQGPASDDVTCPASDTLGAQEAEGK